MPPPWVSAFVVPELGLLLRAFNLECGLWMLRGGMASLRTIGLIGGGMRAKAFPGEDAMSLKTPADIVPLFVRLAAPDCTDNGRLFDFRTGETR